MLKDLFGREIKEGDYVCHVRKIGRYLYNEYGIVMDYTPSGQQIIIQNKKETWHGKERIVVRTNELTSKPIEASKILVRDLVKHDNCWLLVHNVTDIGDNKVRIDLSFGQYIIIDHDDILVHMRE